MGATQLERAFERFDNYNRQDPRLFYWNDTGYPQEFFFATRVHDWVNRLTVPAEPLQLASRCQHIGRWEIPRDSYPEGKAGYLNWRSDLAKYHAAKATQFLGEVGYDSEIISRVADIILKKDLRSDVDVQTMENALCLVFLQFEYEDFIEKHDEPKVIRVLQKTWSKMTQPGRSAALTLDFSERGAALIKKALE